MNKHMKDTIDKWSDYLSLKGWGFLTHEILPAQVTYNDDCPIKDMYFVGIEIDRENKLGTIYHDRELTEADIIHELLHVKLPNTSEYLINEIELLLSKESI